MSISLHRRGISGEIDIVASKSHTIRGLLIATFASGESIIHNPLESEDTAACLEVCRALGAKITLGPNSIKIVGVETFPEEVTLDCRNSGTTLYLATGLAATSGSRITFYGDEQLNKRPLNELLNALTNLGVAVEAEREGYPPYTIKGPLRGGESSLICHSSQFLSALLLAAPLGKGDTTLTIPLLNEKPYVEMTLQWLKRQNISYQASPNFDSFLLKGGQSYSSFETTIGGDYSAAAFFFCAAAIAGTAVTVRGLDYYDSQGDKELLTILEKMGCLIKWTNNAVTVYGRPLKGGQFDLNAMPDTLPILAVTACFAQGETLLHNVPQARIKESDRIASMVANLRALKAEVEEGSDSLLIKGDGHLRGGAVKGFGDHRIIMALAIASLATEEPVVIDSTEAVKVTFPTFFELLEKISKEVSR